MSEGVRYCGHCDEPITPENPGTVTVKISISAGGAVIRRHDKCPQLPAYVRRTPR
ncbi:hypothetical protein [Streptomyces alboniger]|uniref:hypothetical protein n=1 Tax=Streptomyces alboniger TaxID=132473 RepID=UPI000B1422FC|nr:hypothetical protein [Streptomyces alboniger]